MAPSFDLGILEDLIKDAFPPDQPGAAVIITQDGHPLFRKGFGMANLELNVPIEPDMVFRIGSVTKQFTAVSILMLMEQGLLRLDDPLEKFIPGYPTHGHTITIEHLLTHTSGIKSYTSMQEFEKVMTRDMTLQELVDFFKGQPMDFAPGKYWSYNNSAYFLLGMVIEKLSGLSYADFLQQKIFDPLELRHTYYDSPTRIIPRRANGYGKQGDTVVNAGYISMNQPYSAGALASTVDDLSAWDQSLNTGKIVSLDSLQRAWSPYHLADGTPVHYGYGWGLHELHGNPWIAHGGGINGFVCFAARYPAERLFMAVLTNTTSPKVGPEDIVFRAMGILLGKPYEDRKPVEMPVEELMKAVGVYEKTYGPEVYLPGGSEFVFRVVEGQLKCKFPEWGEFLLTPVEGNRFICKELGLTQICPKRDGKGHITGFELVNNFGEVDVCLTKTQRPVPEEAEINQK